MALTLVSINSDTVWGIRGNRLYIFGHEAFRDPEYDLVGNDPVISMLATCVEEIRARRYWQYADYVGISPDLAVELWERGHIGADHLRWSKENRLGGDFVLETTLEIWELRVVIYPGRPPKPGTELKPVCVDSLGNAIY